MVTHFQFHINLLLHLHRSQVRVLAGHHSVVALGKLLTPVYLCHQALLFGTGQGGDLSGWECNRGPGGVMAAYH